MKSLNKEDIFKLLKQNKEKLKNHNVKKIGLFGSVLRGAHTNESDIDLIVEFEEGKKNYDNFIELFFF
ncbi:MAG TPA: nucleotidyltransferase domain-containing protein [Candidatus Nanopelagicaceae bacterium]|nr:nucleotidyltransferase domain-containing protein [Candidatus Nanopelagicaceae bacterium]